MARWLLLLAWLLALPLPLSAQTSPGGGPLTSRSTTLLGAHLTSVPEVLQAHVPTLPRGRGVLVEAITDREAAARLGLRRYDILLTHNGLPIRDPQHLATLWETPTNGALVKLDVVRFGRALTLSVPAEVFAPLVQVPKAIPKGGNQPTLDVEAQALGEGKLQVTLTYYNNTGKLETISSSGSLPEIESEVKQLSAQNRIPPPVQDLVDVALRRLRVLNKQ